MSTDEKKIRARRFRHITERERYTIEAMLKCGKSVQKIAEELGKSRSTIYAEIKRGTVRQRTTEWEYEAVYLADYAQRDYDNKKHEKGRYLKVGNDMAFVRFCENKIRNEKYSPVAVLQALKETDIKTRVCHRTLYQYIHSGVFLNVTSADLPYRVSKQRQKERKRISVMNTKGRSIEERPKKISRRDCFGHWEMDTVVGGKTKSPSCLLVLTERMTRYEEIYYLKGKTQVDVVNVLNDIERQIGLPAFISKYKTFTCDNGSEFLDIKGIENSVLSPDIDRTVLYFCHPFASCERGSNENQNKLIRRWIAKGEDIENYKEKIPFIQDWINNYPRKLFHGMSSNQYIKTLSLPEHSEVYP